MATPQTTIWSMDRHTQAKHEILRKYLGAWLPILLKFAGQARIVDGFAGPGTYENGEIGSPLIALQTLLNHQSSTVQNAIKSQSIELIFIEEDRRRQIHLQKLLEEQKKSPIFPPKLQPQVVCGTFEGEITKILDKMDMQRLGGHAIPTFVFIDPFGYSHTPLSLISRIMSQPMSEVLITLMAEEVNRFLTFDSSSKNCSYDELFGTDQWREITRDAPHSIVRRQRLHGLYSSQLRDIGGAKYVRSFRMRNRRNATDYFLFFGTKSLRGLEEMKRAMWGVDHTGGFEFSDFSNPYQPLLLDKPNYADLRYRLMDHFRGKIVPIEAIREYVLSETPYISFKREALHVLESASPAQIRVSSLNSNRRKGSFSEGSQIEFL
jgi:three-Cys-motif partner protein